MLRVKDGPASIKFYTEQLGMRLLKTLNFPQWKFSLYFLASITDEEMAEAWAKHKVLCLAYGGVVVVLVCAVVVVELLLLLYASAERWWVQVAYPDLQQGDELDPEQENRM